MAENLFSNQEVIPQFAFGTWYLVLIRCVKQCQLAIKHRDLCIASVHLAVESEISVRETHRIQTGGIGPQDFQVQFVQVSTLATQYTNLKRCNLIQDLLRMEGERYTREVYVWNRNVSGLRRMIQRLRQYGVDQGFMQQLDPAQEADLHEYLRMIF